MFVKESEGNFSSKFQRSMMNWLTLMMPQFGIDEHGWQFIYEVAMEQPNADGVRLPHDKRADDNPMWTKLYVHIGESKGGSFAEGKMNYLKMFPTCENSSCRSMERLRYILDEMILHGDKFNIAPAEKLKIVEDEIFKTYISVNDLPKGVYEVLRDNFGIIPLTGAIRVPIRDTASETNGEILLSMSGFPKGEQDLLICDIMYRAIWRHLKTKADPALQSIVVDKDILFEEMEILPFYRTAAAFYTIL